MQRTFDAGCIGTGFCGGRGMHRTHTVGVTTAVLNAVRRLLMCRAAAGRPEGGHDSDLAHEPERHEQAKVTAHHHHS